MDESNRLFKFLAYALCGIFVLVLIVTCGRATGREVFNTLRSLVATAFVLAVTWKYRKTTAEHIRKDFEEFSRSGRGKKWGIHDIVQFTSLIYKPSFFAYALAYIILSAAAATWVAHATDRYFVRMFLMMFSVFLLIGCQGERQYVMKRTKKILNKNK